MPLLVAVSVALFVAVSVAVIVAVYVEVVAAAVGDRVPVDDAAERPIA